MESNKERKRRSADEWKDLISQCEARDCTKSEFLARHNITSWTLKYHLDKARESTTGFTPIVPTAASSSQEITVSFPNGLNLTIRG